MKKKIVLSILLVSTLINSCTDNRDDDAEKIVSSTTIKLKKKTEIGSKGNEKFIPKSDTIKIRLENAKEITDQLDDGGDPKDVPPRR